MFPSFFYKINSLELSGNGTVDIDCKSNFATIAEIEATGNVTVNLINNNNLKFLFLFSKQDGIGGHTFSFSSAFKLSTPAPIQNTNVGDMDSWYFVLSNGKFRLSSFSDKVQ